jgi:hypothetical protein
MCLFYAHSYPPRYINSEFNKFHSSYLPVPFILPMITNENDFAFICRSILNEPTIPEYQIALRIVKSINVVSREKVDNPLVKAQLGKQTKFDTNLIIHRTHEKRFQSNKKRYSSIMESNIQMNTSHRYKTYYWKSKQS